MTGRAKQPELEDYERRVLKEMQKYEQRVAQEMDPEATAQLQEAEAEISRARYSSRVEKQIDSEKEMQEKILEIFGLSMVTVF